MINSVHSHNHELLSVKEIKHWGISVEQIPVNFFSLTQSFILKQSPPLI